MEGRREAARLIHMIISASASTSPCRHIQYNEWLRRTTEALYPSESSNGDRHDAKPSDRMRHEQQMQVEVYSHGGWWKDSQGRTGQIPPEQANKGPMATIATVANGFGVEGWELTDLVSGHHNTYILTFQLVSTTGQKAPAAASASPISASQHLG